MSDARQPKYERSLHRLIAARAATVGVIGLGYVGLPLLVAFARADFATIGFDIDDKKIAQLHAATSYIYAVQNKELRELLAHKRFRATSNFAELASCDVVVICVPTPLTRHREPDLSYVEGTARTIAKHLRRGQLVVLESTTYPGTTAGVVKPILECTGLNSGSDFFLGFSPEREDPGNTQFNTVSIPKIVAGDGPQAQSLVEAFYGAVIKRVVPVSSLDVGEAVKITENIFRAVNIALVNELKMIYTAMGIDVWEVIEAAATKPFGFMPFYPGPGLGGHCIPIDPFYLTWVSRAYDQPTRFVELAGEINLSMPRYCVNRLEEALDLRLSLPVSRARILLLGIAYKKNVADFRESPSFKLISLLEKRGAKVEYHDPHVPVIPITRDHPEYAGRKSIAIESQAIECFDAIMVATDHDEVDYGLVAASAKLIVDTRNVFARKGLRGDHIVKA